jgi:hypothetical protein
MRNKIKRLYWKLSSWFCYNSWIYISSLNFRKPLRTWKQAKDVFVYPKPTFRYGKLEDTYGGFLFVDYHRMAHKILSLRISDVSCKWKFDDVCFEAPPYITLVLFNRWKFVWTFNGPLYDNQTYWDALLTYLYIDDKDIKKTKEEYGWVRYVRDEEGNEERISCWSDDMLTPKYKNELKYIIPGSKNYG